MRALSQREPRGRASQRRKKPRTHKGPRPFLSSARSPLRRRLGPRDDPRDVWIFSRGCGDGVVFLVAFPVVTFRAFLALTFLPLTLLLTLIYAGIGHAFLTATPLARGRVDARFSGSVGETTRRLAGARPTAVPCARGPRIVWRIRGSYTTRGLPDRRARPRTVGAIYTR